MGQSCSIVIYSSGQYGYFFLFFFPFFSNHMSWPVWHIKAGRFSYPGRWETDCSMEFFIGGASSRLSAFG